MTPITTTFTARSRSRVHCLRDRPRCQAVTVFPLGTRVRFTASARGLVPAAITAGTVLDDPTNGSCSLTAPNAQLVSVVIPAGTTYARFQLFDADVAAGSDIDMCVFRGTTLVGSSGTGTSAEIVSLLNPTAATYTVVIQGWGVPVSSPFKLHTWVLGSTAAGNMTVSAPSSATIGTIGNINLTFSGLVPWHQVSR